MIEGLQEEAGELQRQDRLLYLLFWYPDKPMRDGVRSQHGDLQRLLEREREVFLGSRLRLLFPAAGTLSAPLELPERVRLRLCLCLRFRTWA